MGNHLYSPDASDGVRKKIRFFVILVGVLFLALWMRVWYLQILKGENFRGLSENNRVRMASLPPYRGKIMDRNGETLVSIRPSFNLYITPEDTRNVVETLEFLATKIEFNQQRLREKLEAASPFQNVLIKSDLPRREVAFVEENNRLLPGVHIKVVPLRDYVYKNLAAHIFGYLGEISKKALDENTDKTYEAGDLVGKGGVELLYENLLRGEKGYKEVEVDVAGRELETLRKLPPKSGDNLVLTLDLRLQRVAESLMQGTEENPRHGAMVLMKAQTGEILAMVSQPSFDPNLFASGVSRKTWGSLVLDKYHPLQNRTIDGQYPPGSTYKILTALAGLEEKVVTPETKIFCPGYFRLGRGLYRCWKKGGHGHVNLFDALVQSCDVYFYTVGHRLGIDTLAKYSKNLGLGQRTMINLVGEKPGLVPTTAWKEKTRRERWQPGETISASIGQGFNLVTPLQQARLIGTVANGGLVLRPYLVLKTQDSEGKVFEEFFPKILSRISVDPENLKLVREALLGVVQNRRGTGRRARIKNVPVAGKTGTAQVVRMKTVEGDQEEEETPYEFRDHAWFVAFAPYEKPEVAVAVIVEHGGHGGSTAAPLARELIQAYHKYYPLTPLQEAIIGPKIPVQ
ncbi:MAG: penicillin-binding protein 2 [Nitrospinaceae bacterium]